MPLIRLGCNNTRTQLPLLSHLFLSYLVLRLAPLRYSLSLTASTYQYRFCIGSNASILTNLSSFRVSLLLVRRGVSSESQSQQQLSFFEDNFCTLSGNYNCFSCEDCPGFFVCYMFLFGYPLKYYSFQCR